jgi:hypothetical protein
MKIAILITLFGATLAYAGANYNAAVIADSPAAWWKLNESSGGVMVDSSGNGLDGGYHDGFSLGHPGIFGVGCSDTSVLFSGGNPGGGYGTVDDNAAFHIATTGQFTVEAWIYTLVAPAFNITAVGKGDRVIAPPDAFEWELEPHNSGADWLWLPLQDSGAIHAQATSTTAVSTSAFQYIVGTIIDSTNVKIYVNSVLENTSTSFTGTAGSGTSHVNIAKFRDCSSSPCVDQFLNAYAAHVAIYPTALSLARVQAHYTAAQADIAACAASPTLHRRVYQMK